MLSIEKRIAAFTGLGILLKSCSDDSIISLKNQTGKLVGLIKDSHLENPWFTGENVRHALYSIGLSLEETKIRKWLRAYDLENINTPKRVGVVMAGNIPLVGFHDFLCVLISGHRFIGKLSSDDNKLLPAIAEILVDIEPGFKDRIEFAGDKLQGFDAIIATGSNNTARYFEYYFGKYPHIIRKNRNGVAVFTGNETKAELTGFGKDLFLYFGMGCRSVAKVFVPKGYAFDKFFKAISGYRYVGDHNKYYNNYEYYRSIYLINQVSHFDNGFLLVKHDDSYSSPPSVLFYEEYEDISGLRNRLMVEKEQIQCIVGNTNEIENCITFGQAQNPDLWDYADGTDTMKFLINL